MRTHAITATAITAAVTLTACGGGSPATDTPPSASPYTVPSMGTGPSQDTGLPISDAVCNDLGANGWSMFQVKAMTAKTTDMSGQEYAEFLRANLGLACPQMLTDDGIRRFMLAWNVNPDA